MRVKYEKIEMHAAADFHISSFILHTFYMPDPSVPLDPKSERHWPLCEVLLFVAVPSEEKQLLVVAKELGIPVSRVEGAGHGFEDFDFGFVGSNRVRAVRTEMGALSYGGSAARAIYAKTETGATTLVSLGMAFGADRKRQHFGDVLVSTMLLPYDYRTVKTIAGQACADYSSVVPHPAKQSLLGAFWRESWKAEWSGKVHFGALLTGAARIHSALFRDELVKGNDIHGEPIVGGEMEGVGLLATCDP